MPLWKKKNGNKNPLDRVGVVGGGGKGSRGEDGGREKGISSISEEWWVKSLTEDF